MSTDMLFSAVESKHARPAQVADIIAAIFRADEDAAFLECRPYLTPPGVTGNAQWDHCEVVSILIKYDQEMGNRLAGYMVANGVAKAGLWRYVANALRKAGFELHNGRVVGILEDKSSQDK